MAGQAQGGSVELQEHGSGKHSRMQRVMEEELSAPKVKGANNDDNIRHILERDTELEDRIAIDRKAS
jgi:hypothetical protein